MHWFIERGQSYPENRPSKIACSVDFPVGRGAPASTTIEIFYNAVDRSAPRYQNRNTKRVAQLNVNTDRIHVGRKIFSSKKRKMGGHWYYCFSFDIEATYESAWIRYTLKLKGMLPSVSDM